jgi:hypothetical protein
LGPYTSLIPPLVIEVSVPGQVNCMYMVIDFASFCDFYLSQ